MVLYLSGVVFLNRKDKYHDAGYYKENNRFNKKLMKPGAVLQVSFIPPASYRLHTSPKCFNIGQP
jgi:hypothetical protein